MYTFWRYFVFIFLLHALLFEPTTSKKGKGKEKPKGKEKKRSDWGDYDDDWKPNNWDVRAEQGKEATKGQFPYVISVQYYSFHFCAGALLAPNWVVSSAQCFNFKPESTAGLTVTAGMTNVSDTSSDVQQKNLTRIVVHSKFYIQDKCKLLTNDIALLQPTTPFTLNNIVKTIKLPKPKESFTGKGTLLGWTSHQWGIITLKYTEANIMTAKDCRMSKGYWPRDIGYQFHNKSMICAKPISTTITLCVGNTGSPLVYKNMLVGLASTGDNPCKVSPKRTFIGYYTKISRYIKFINKHVTTKGGGTNYDFGWY